MAYTADSSAADPECRDTPAWAGLVCRTGPAGQPATGLPLPVTYTTGYDHLLTATRVEERVDGTTERTSVTEHDVAGRKVREDTTVTNPPVLAEPGAGQVSFKGATTRSSNWISSTISYPGGVQAGDILLLFATVARAEAEATVTVPAGWALVGTEESFSMTTRVYVRVADGSEMGSATVLLDPQSKIDQTMLRYSGVSTTNPVAQIVMSAEAGGTERTTPTVITTAESGLVVSYWADKSSSTTDWTPPAGVVQRAESIGTGQGRITSLTADPGVQVPAGTSVGGLTASTDVSGGRAVAVTVVLTAAAGAPETEPEPEPEQVSYGYDPATGQPTTTTAGGQTLTTSYDTWGRVRTQTDGAGNTAVTGYDTAGRVATLDDGKGTYTYSYDGTDANGLTERRGVVTALDVDLPGGQPDVFYAAYDADGATQRLDYPNGVTATWARDAAGDETGLVYTTGGVELLGFTTMPDVDGRTRLATGPASEQAYSYDNRGRLTTVQDTYDGACTTGSYGFSGDSNRTSLASHPADTDGTCTTATTPTVVTSAFDEADRITDAGYSYDRLGRTLTVPAAHTSAPDGSALTVAYHGDDMVAKLSQTVPDGFGSTVAQTKRFTLDPQSRLSQVTDRDNGAETRRIVNHYADSADSPAWIATSPDRGTTWTWQRHVSTPTGDLGLIQAEDGTTTVQLANLHGDTVATMPNTPDPTGGIATYSEATEYGQPRNPDTAPDRYGWLGAKQRSTDTIGGLTLMGVRLYNPATGRFLTIDPIEGGNDNPYTYPADPINKVDLDGKLLRWAKKKLKKNWKSYLGYAAAAACIAATAGACLVATAAVVAVSAASNYRAYRSGRISARRAIFSTGFDTIGLRVRALRGFTMAKHRVGGPKRISMSIKRSLRKQPKRSAFRFAYNAASSYKTYRGW